jgi:hypothetical protein
MSNKLRQDIAAGTHKPNLRVLISRGSDLNTVLEGLISGEIIIVPL